MVKDKKDKKQSPATPWENESYTRAAFPYHSSFLFLFVDRHTEHQRRIPALLIKIKCFFVKAYSLYFCAIGTDEIIWIEIYLLSCQRTLSPLKFKLKSIKMFFIKKIK